MPGDPIVNDHYGDVPLEKWQKNSKRYYWNYVLSLEETEDELKKSIEVKLIKGI